MLENEIDDFIHDLEHQLAQQGLDIDLYLKSRSMEMSELREEVKDNAEARMKRGLILVEIAKAENINIPAEKITERVEQTIQEVAAYYSEEEANRLGSGQNLESLRSRIATDEMITQTLKTLRDIAMGKLETEKESDDSQVDAPEEEKEAVEKLTTQVSNKTQNESTNSENDEPPAASEEIDEAENEKTKNS
jgi:FKBP-type peptidyl-prolyl cis-trans isomerase (trigger factor)